MVCLNLKLFLEIIDFLRLWDFFEFVEILFKESHGSKNKRTESDEKQKYFIRSFADGVKSDSSDDNDDEYVPDESELKYSWYEDEPDEREGKILQRGKKSAAMWKQSLNVTYREEDAVTAKKKKKKRKTARKMGDTKPLDDGSEKVYRQRIRWIFLKIPPLVRIHWLMFFFWTKTLRIIEIFHW